MCMCGVCMYVVCVCVCACAWGIVIHTSDPIIALVPGNVGGGRVVMATGRSDSPLAKLKELLFGSGRRASGLGYSKSFFAFSEEHTFAKFA